MTPHGTREHSGQRQRGKPAVVRVLGSWATQRVTVVLPEAPQKVRGGAAVGVGQTNAVQLPPPRAYCKDRYSEGRDQRCQLMPGLKERLEMLQQHEGVDRTTRRKLTTTRLGSFPQGGASRVPRVAIAVFAARLPRRPTTTYTRNRIPRSSGCWATQCLGVAPGD